MSDQRLREALEVAVLGLFSLDERRSEEAAPDLAADEYAERGLLDTGRDITGEGFCHLTEQGAAFIREALAAPTSPALDAEEFRQKVIDALPDTELYDGLNEGQVEEALDSVLATFAPPGLDAEDRKQLELMADRIVLGRSLREADAELLRRIARESLAPHQPESQQEGRGELRDRLLDELEKARQWRVAPGCFHGDALSEEELAAGGVQVVELAAVNAAIDAALDLQGEEGR